MFLLRNIILRNLLQLNYMKIFSTLTPASLLTSMALMMSLFMSCNSSSKSKDIDNKAHTTSTSSSDNGENVLSIAYVNVDSLLANYQLAKDANETLMRRFESSRATINEKQRRLESEYKEFQRKIQANAFLSEERARQESDRLQNLSNELEKTANRLDEDLRQEQLRINNQLADSVQNAINIFNQTANYELILSNSGMDNILFAKEKYDITDKVLALLNSRYTPAKK